MSIQSIKPQNEGLNVLWNDGSSDLFPWIWIRDHSESEKDLHPDSKQRQIDVFSNKLDNSIISVAIQKKSMVGMEKNSNSPFIGLSVNEAHENLIEQKSQIKNLVAPDLQQMRRFNDETLVKWVKKIREVGEYQATVWLNNDG